MKRIDMTGWKLWEHGVPDSKIIVLNKHINENKDDKHIYWDCLCTLCGKEFIDNGKGLRSGNKKSCGCLHKQKIIERNASCGQIINIGDKFGFLTVIKDLGFRKQKSRDKSWRWSLCQCDCGSEPIEVPNALLINGHKKSCGCMKSYGEEIICQILKEHNLVFKREYKFDDLFYKDSNKPLRFDFAIFQNDELLCLIEFDGRQHYSGPEAAWSHASSLEEIKHKDELKNKYCKNHNLLLKRIPYFELSNLSYESIFSDKYNFVSEAL